MYTVIDKRVCSKCFTVSSFFLIVSFIFCVSMSSAQGGNTSTAVENVTVRYINESAVNISWSQITEVNDNEIEGYTVYYSPITATNQKSRSIKNVTFNGNGNSTNHGVIVGLSTSETGYQFLVVVRTSESGSVQETCALDLRTVIAVHNRSGEQDKTTEDKAPMDIMRVDVIVSVVVCVIGTFTLYTIVVVIILCCYRRSQTQIKRLKKEVMAVNELDFPNPGIIGDASEYKVAPLHPLDTLSSDHQSSTTADIERETVFANKGGSSAE